jgi:hypothetical protein
MNPTVHYRGSLTGRPTSAATPAASATSPVEPERVSGARAADYVADIFFIALLAAPFLVFEAPSSVPEAAIAARSAPPAASAPAPRDTSVKAVIPAKEVIPAHAGIQ